MAITIVEECGARPTAFVNVMRAMTVGTLRRVFCPLLVVVGCCAACSSGRSVSQVAAPGGAEPSNAAASGGGRFTVLPTCQRRLPWEGPWAFVSDNPNPPAATPAAALKLDLVSGAVNFTGTVSPAMAGYPIHGWHLSRGTATSAIYVSPSAQVTMSEINGAWLLTGGQKTCK